MRRIIVLSAMGCLWTHDHKQSGFRWTHWRFTHKGESERIQTYHSGGY